jgi:hypothetical protein
MLRIDSTDGRLVALEAAPPGTLTQRYDLRELIGNSPEAFFQEMGERFFLIGTGLPLSSEVPIKTDLLALDEKGLGVVMIAQGAQEGLSLARAITCAGLLARWRPDDFIGCLPEERASALRSFLSVPVEQINREQRTVLLAEVFDFEVLTATKWLWERNRMDNVCLRVFLLVDKQNGTEYLGCQDVSDEGASVLTEAGKIEQTWPALAGAGTKETVGAVTVAKPENRNGQEGS